MQKGKFIMTAVMLVVCVSFSSAQAQKRADRSVKNTGMQFFKASTSEVSGYRTVNLKDGSTLYVAPRMSFASQSVQTATINTTGGEVLQLTLSADAGASLAEASHVAIYMKGNFFGSASIDGISDDGQISISGLSSRQMNQITQMTLRKGAILQGGTITVVPRQTSVRGGDTLTVDMYLSGAVGVRAYQVKLEVTGGDAGALDRDQMIIDTNQRDYIFAAFGTSEVIKGEDQVNGRIGALMISGSVDATQRSYLGSETFRVSDDASGSFQISINRVDTLLTDERGNPKPFQIVGATVTAD